MSLRDPAHILIVDDDDRIRDLTKRFLTLKGYRVTGAPDAAGARRLMDNMTFDLAVLDIMMPTVDGYQVCTHVKKHFGHVKVVFLSAKSKTADIEAGLALGADLYLTKPFSNKELVRQIKQLLN